VAYDFAEFIGDLGISLEPVLLSGYWMHEITPNREEMIQAIWDARVNRCLKLYSLKIDGQ
jgi:hypothetical protein